MKQMIKYQFMLEATDLVLKVHAVRLMFYSEISFNSHPYPLTNIFICNFYSYNKYFHSNSSWQPELSHLFIQVDLKYVQMFCGWSNWIDIAK